MKRLLYRDTPEMLIILCISLICLPLTFVLSEAIIFLILFFIAISVFVHEKWNKKFNVGNNFFWCKRSILCKKSVWIVQHTIGWNNCKGCAQYEVVKEMSYLLNNIADNTICYCCTHEVIKKQIVKKYVNVELTPIYKKNLKRLKMAIRTDTCKKCNKKDCSIFQNEKVQFYAIKFIK